MSDEIAPEQPAPEDLNGGLPSHDWALESLVDIVSADNEHGGVAFTVSVVLQGTVVTGLLCSAGEWIDTIRTLPVSGMDEGNKFVEAIANNFHDFLASARPLQPGERREFFHLKDAHVLSNGTSFDVAGFRGRLADVGGWMFPGEYRKPAPTL